MSIIRNSRSTSSEQTTDNSRRIKRFLKSEEFLAGCGHWPRYWVGLNNKYLKQATTPWGKLSLSLGDTVVVKCEIAQDAVGPILGAAGSDSIKIVKEGSNIKWYKGTTALRTEAWSDGIHLYGFFNSSNGMYPYYDRDVSGTKITACNTRSLFIGRLSADSALGDGTGDCIYSTTQTYAIKVYEVVGVLTYAYSSATEKRITHYYAATTSISGTTPRMFETRYHSGAFYLEVGDGSAVSGVTAVAGLGDFPDLFSEINKKQSGYSSKNPQSLGWYEYNGSAFVPSTDTAVNQSKTYYDKGYGIQLLDLTDMFGGPYKDLVGMVCADNAQQTISAADAAEVLENGNETRELAFRVAGGSTSPSSPIPLPTGWSVQNRPSSIVRSYIKGELIYGRMPRWSIWADAIKFGKYSDTSVQPNKLHFNFLKENDGTDATSQEFDLTKFDGYDESKIYPPSFSISGELVMEFHNGMACTLDDNGWAVGNTQQVDEARVFVFSQGAGGLSNVRLGNLPLWNYSKSELDSGSVALQNMRAVSGGLVFYVSDQPVLVFFKSTEQTYTEGGVTYPVPFCSDSNQDTLDMFKYDGFSGEAFFREDLSDYLKRVLAGAGASGINLKVALAMSLEASPTPSNMNIIDCSNLVPAQTSHAIGSFNPRHSSGTPSGQHVYGDRVIIGENGGIAKAHGNDYTMCVAQSNANSGDWRISREITVGGGNTDHYGYGIGILLGLIDNTNQVVDLFDSNNNDAPLYVAYLEATAGAVHSSEGATAIKERFIGFAKLFKNKMSTISGSGYFAPFAYDNWDTHNLYNHKQDKSKTNQSETKVAAAFFMWQDLLSPGISRGSGGKADTEPTSTDAFPKRFTYNNSGTTVKAPVTAHIKMFKLDEAPHCWNVYDDGHRQWDDTTACPYIVANSRDFYFHYNNNLIESGDSNCVDAYVSVWNGNTQISSAADLATALNGRTVTLYSQVPYEPQEQRETNTLATFAISNLSGSTTYKELTSGNYSFRVDTAVQVPFWTTLKNNTYGMMLNGFVHIRIWYNQGSDLSSLKAKTFFINIS